MLRRDVPCMGCEVGRSGLALEPGIKGSERFAEIGKTRETWKAEHEGLFPALLGKGISSQEADSVIQSNNREGKLGYVIGLA